MFNKIKRSIARGTFVVLGSAMVISTVGVVPAHADVTAEFTATAFAEAKAEAEAKAAAVGDIDVTARTLLEEERASIPASIVKKWKSPTKEQVSKFGTLVHSMDAAQQAFTQQIKVYHKIINDARLAVAKAKIKYKYADTQAQKRKWLKRLIKAKRHLRAIYVDEHWKYRPLVGMDSGCFRNTGRTGHMVLHSFVECVAGNKAAIWFGYDLNEEAVRVVLVVFKDGTTKDGCLNFAFFDIPEGTTPEDLVLVVDALLKVQVTVRVAVTVTGRLTVKGVMKRDGVVCDEEEKTQEISVTRYVEKTVTGKDSAEAMEIAESEVNADVELKESVKAEVEKSATVELSKTITLSCPEDEKPMIVDVTRPNDTNPGWTTPACAVADFPKGHSGTLYFAFESGTVQGTNPVQVNDLQQGCVTLVSPTEPGWYTYKVTATDSVTGLSVTKESQPYHVYATPPPG